MECLPTDWTEALWGLGWGVKDAGAEGLGAAEPFALVDTHARQRRPRGAEEALDGGSFDGWAREEFRYIGLVGTTLLALGLTPQQG